MELSTDDVRKVAVLARLEFSDEQLQAFTSEMGRIVTFVDQLGQVATDGIEPMAHPLDIHSVTRVDELRPGLTREQALQNAPQHNDECFLVPPVMSGKH
ncbi:MAG: Asp-tRNA(Asn)/Glu-tRNA(Gln) amidotransferase subunit GatC [Planctomycetales bacterium]|nr:Asp-tRNA(Asn)/Glu-tRNA(Gln) amidotransferase subunit GatC [Planctomycetales bacterium]